jgi:hypothetical protein
LKLKATAETYIFLCVASKLSTKNLLLYELTRKYARALRREGEFHEHKNTNYLYSKKTT